jgi:transcription factor C subunit 3
MRLVDPRVASYCHTLRHLTVVRDSAIRGTISFYIQYSLRNFAGVVQRGRATWESVESGKKGESLQSRLETQYDYDGYGFVQSDGPPGLVNGGNATLRHCLEVVKPRGYVANIRDPVAVRGGDGSYRKSIITSQRYVRVVC